ncbi:ribosomal RNA processing protein 36 homolog [Parasteatoda tepidariorum]|uniref:ribosomal RNA processing protein 36 homolog n=1 Tax=Parasteatoda tepidariorum TaxID=114398 RepID=UPI000A2C026D|nr:ribosomal RNA processing protein 36 homolog [Parasteatoda tepidariorum]
MSFSRANKNRPREMSSKTPVPVFRDVFAIKKAHSRDPRFDDLSGTFDEELFEENYSFVDDIKRKEREKLEKELENVGDDHKRKQEILYLLLRMKNQDIAKKKQKMKKIEDQQLREEIMEAAKSGKKPYMPKKSELKQKKLVESFQKLKKTGKLDKYLERKRKKIVSKDRKRFCAK